MDKIGRAFPDDHTLALIGGEETGELSWQPVYGSGSRLVDPCDSLRLAHAERRMAAGVHERKIIQIVAVKTVYRESQGRF